MWNLRGAIKRTNLIRRQDLVKNIDNVVQVFLLQILVTAYIETVSPDIISVWQLVSILMFQMSICRLLSWYAAE